MKCSYYLSASLINFIFLSVLILPFCGYAQSELPCLLARDLPDNEIGIYKKYLDQCHQLHVTAFENKGAEELYKALNVDEKNISDSISEKKLSIALPSPLDQSEVSVLCTKEIKQECHEVMPNEFVEENVENYKCTFIAPIINYNINYMPDFGSYNPDFWLSFFHAEFFIKDQNYIFSPKIEFQFSKNTGATSLVTQLKQESFDFMLKDRAGYPVVSFTCEKIQSFDSEGPLCRIVF